MAKIPIQDNVVVLFGKNVRALRRNASLSQDELAFRANVKRSYLSDIERGLRNPTVIILGQIARALEVHPSRLLMNPGDEIAGPEGSNTDEPI